jgi:hypothetical protein
MKQLFIFFFLFLFSNTIHAQCTDLFFSEYVEGWSNNKALEIYNPTNETIDLSAYSISRYSNGGTSPSTTQLTGTIEPYSTFVVGLDKRDPDGEGYEAPMWDGYYTYTDSITSEEVTIYDANTDLQNKVDLFVNPIYYFGTNADSAAAFPTSLYFNGNDAITLEILGAGIVLDLIGKVGKDPGAAWTDNDGNYWTKDHTLIRKESVLNGVTENPIVFDPTLEWDSLPANTFINLGTHDCACNPNNQLTENQNTFIVSQKGGIIKVVNNLPINYIKIYDINGKVVFNKTINQVNQIELDKKQENGIYFISLIDTKGVKTKSIVLLDE